MNRPMSAVAAVMAMGLVAGACAPKHYSLLRGDRVFQKRLDRMWEEEVFPMNEPVHHILLQKTEFQSVVATRFVGPQKAQRNPSQDMTVFIQRGKGTLFINDFPITMASGDVATVPRGASQYFVTESTSSVTDAIVVLSPASETVASEPTKPAGPHKKK